MIQFKTSIVVGAVILILASCQNPSTAPTFPAGTVSSIVTKGIELDTRLNDADSLVLVFYKNPFATDSLRYTRFYKQQTTTGIDVIRPLLNNLDLPFNKREKINSCRSEGKMWVYSKGKLFQTIYFAYTKPSCAFIYLIKDGYFYYIDIQQPFINKLEEFKKIAVEP